MDNATLKSVSQLVQILDQYAHSPPILVLHAHVGPFQRTAKLHNFIIQTTQCLLQLGGRAIHSGWLSGTFFSALGLMFNGKSLSEMVGR